MSADSLSKAACAEKAPLLLFLDHTDLWVSRILPFLGPGHYMFVAGINHQFKELYQEYFSKIQKIPKVHFVLENNIYDYAARPALVTSTFYSAAFYSLSCAKLWKIARAREEEVFRVSNFPLIRK